LIIRGRFYRHNDTSFLVAGLVRDLRNTCRRT
jgi:hypothetical protein